MFPPLKLAFASNLKEVPTCSPNLMPFHIDYSGPAPISTYFRVKPSQSRVGAPPANPTAEDANTSAISPPVPSESSWEEQPAFPAPATPSTSSLTDSAARFVASFRGRTVQGLQVGLPGGYGGVILRVEGAGAGADVGATRGTAAGVTTKQTAHGKGKASGKPTGRVTRRSTKAAAPADEDLTQDVDMDIGADGDPGDASGDGKLQEPARTLGLASTFSSFVLWHPDIPVDERNDEYYRSLMEWTSLAAHIHLAED